MNVGCHQSSFGSLFVLIITLIFLPERLGLSNLMHCRNVDNRAVCLRSKTVGIAVSPCGCLKELAVEVVRSKISGRGP